MRGMILSGMLLAAMGCASVGSVGVNTSGLVSLVTEEGSTDTRERLRRTLPFGRSALASMKSSCAGGQSETANF